MFNEEKFWKAKIHTELGWRVKKCRFVYIAWRKIGAGFTEIHDKMFANLPELYESLKKAKEGEEVFVAWSKK